MINRMFVLVALATLGCTKKETYLVPNLPGAELIINSEDRPLKPIFKYKSPTGTACTATVVYNNYAVTAAHCVKPHVIYSVVGTKETVRAVSIELSLDRAILFGKFDDRAATVIDNRRDIIHLTPAVVYCGYPAGSNSPICKAAQRQGLDYFNVVFSNTAMPGMSGGPVIDRISGELCGIVVAVHQDGATVAVGTVGMFELAGIRLPE